MKKNLSCYDRALLYLGMREHNRHELFVKLASKGYEKSQIDEALDTLEKENYLNEKRYVQAFVRSSNNRHPEGKKTVCMRLLAKGADSAVVKEILDEIYTQDYVLFLANEALEKLHDKGVVDLFEVKFALFKAGFSESEVNSVINNDK